MRTLLLIALGLAALVAAAIALNLLLLGYTSPQGEMVGKLNPVATVKLARESKPVLRVPNDERDD